MAENWCPVIVENEVGERWAVHLDPLLIRQHRMKVRQELFDVQETLSFGERENQRSMMLRRIHEIRQSLPKAEPEESRKCWEKELKEAEHRRNEPLVRAFPPNIRHVTVFLEVSMHMVQLELVGRHLKEELWPRLVASQVECLTLVALDGREIEVEVTETGRASLTAFLDVLDPPPPRCLHSTQSQSRRSRSTGTAPELFMAPQLSKAIATDALLGHGAGLFVLCSKPADLEECEVLLKRSQLILQLCGVLGASPDDPEHSYERLVKAAAPGSALHLWRLGVERGRFGAPYWDAFAAERRQHLEALRPLLQETQRLGGRLPAQLGVLGDGEVVSGAVLEIRLLERVMRECYVDEQRCEEELKILTQLLSKELVEPHEVSVVRRSPRQRDADEADQARSEVARNTAVSKDACAGAALMLTLELRELLASAKEQRQEAHKSQDVERGTKELDEQILCEAWLCAIGTQLDAGPEREMLWRCTVMSFSRSAHFEVHQQAFRQNLFNDTLMAQRVAKKDLSTRFYIRIADTLRQKFSFDFYNPMVVQKCIATTQALLNDRDVAVVGEAGAGKTDCIMTMLEAAEDFPDDLGQPLFPKVKLMRINTLAHDVEDALLVVSRAAAEAQRKRRTEEQDEKSREDIWLTLDGPMNPELFESVAGAMPLSIMGQNKPYLPKTRAYRIIVETDYLARLSPATASSLAVTYIDTERGPTWKDRAMAWVHRFVLTCPEYAKFLELTKELLMHLMDS
eukprot:g26168.t1